MKTVVSFAVVILLSYCCFSCKETASSNEYPVVVKSTQPVKRVTTAEEQKGITPDEILQKLKEGNSRFTANNITQRDHSSQVRYAAYGQYPKSVVLSCLDSRIPVEDVFDKGIGDMFVARNAGNLINEDIMGSFEYACAVAGAKVIVVMGHSGCGAVESAIKNVEMGNITNMLAKIKPAIKMTKQQHNPSDESSKEFCDNVGKNNVRNSMNSIIKSSPILDSLIRNGRIKMVGAYYDIETGKVDFL